MKILVQECLKASVIIDGKTVGNIDRGEVIFVGFTQSDTCELVDKMISKLLKLRIFPDENNKTNLNLSQINGQLLVVSQFTLYADLSEGNRPSFVNALSSEKSVVLYNRFVESLKKYVPNLQTGVFGADMKVILVNDGPFTIILDSKEIYHE